MTKLVLLNDGAVWSDIILPDGVEAKDLYPTADLERIVKAPDEVSFGWTYDGKTFSPPPTPEALPIEPAAPPHLTFLEFLALFTADEQAAIATSLDPQVCIFRWKAAGASYVDLGDAQTVSGVAYLVGKDLLTQARADAVLSGAPPA